MLFIDLKRKYSRTRRTRRKKRSFIGDQYGPLTILADVLDTKPRRVLVSCECGVIKTLLLSTVRGKTGECTCFPQKRVPKKREKLVSIGDRFDRLVVIKKGEKIGYKQRWICLCDCGNEKEVAQESLRNKMTRSCGCLQKERTRKGRFIDLTGEKFGSLTVVRKVEYKEGSKVTRWLCSCVCGETPIVYLNNLTQGNTRSCGCRTSTKVSSWKTWTEREEFEMIQSINKGVSYDDIAEAQERSVATIYKRISHLVKEKNLKRCTAKDCKKYFFAKLSTAKYCSDRCRWRVSAQKTSEERRKKGNCPQCGDAMDSSSATYCTKCQDYFRQRNQKIKNEKE